MLKVFGCTRKATNRPYSKMLSDLLQVMVLEHRNRLSQDPIGKKRKTGRRMMLVISDLHEIWSRTLEVVKSMVMNKSL